MSTFQLKTNVIPEKDYKEKVTKIFNFVSSVMKNTLGPNAAPTLFEDFGQHNMTKDGYNILKQLRFNDAISNNILKLIIQISMRMVSKVGDGSTSSIVAADVFLNKLESSEMLSNIRTKDFDDLLNKVITLISKEIETNATPITEENLEEMIYNIANISTNGNEHFSEMIRDLYKQFGVNLTLTVEKNPMSPEIYTQTYDGYKAPIKLMDRIFANAGNEYKMRRPKIMIFDHCLTLPHFELIDYIKDNVCSQDEQLFVLCPSIDMEFAAKLNNIVREQTDMKQKGRIRLYPVIYGLMSLFNKHMNNIMQDFAIMTGARILTIDEANRMIEPYTNKVTFNEEILNTCTGTVELITVGLKTEEGCVIKGFCNRDEELYNSIVAAAKQDFEESFTKCMAFGLFDMDHHLINKRYKALISSLATIFVGGENQLDRDLNHDALEDAVKACESAISYGVNNGCNLAIIKACNTLLSNTSVPLSVQEMDLIETVRDTFIEVYRIILSNKFADSSKINDIITQSIHEDKCFNLITEEYSDKVINSSQTDTEILFGAFNLIKSIFICNQYIALEPAFDVEI